MKRTTIELTESDQKRIKEIEQTWQPITGKLSMIGTLRLALRLAVTVTPKKELIKVQS